jgi:hypothetical protein
VLRSRSAAHRVGEGIDMAAESEEPKMTAEVAVVPSTFVCFDATGDDLDDEDRARLHACLERGIRVADAGDLGRPLAECLADERARREKRRQRP